MALIQAQIDAVKTQCERAAQGDRGALEFISNIERDAKAGNMMSVEMLEEIQNYRVQNNLQNVKPLIGVNLTPLQVEAARKTLVKLSNDPNDFDGNRFWKSLELNATTGDPVAIEFLKARDQINAQIAAENGITIPGTQQQSGTPGWTSGRQNPPGYSPPTPTAQLVQNSHVQAPLPVTPAVVPPPSPGIQSNQPNTFGELQALVKQMLSVRDEIFVARDQILKALRVAPPAPIPPQAPTQIEITSVCEAPVGPNGVIAPPGSPSNGDFIQDRHSLP